MRQVSKQKKTLSLGLGFIKIPPAQILTNFILSISISDIGVSRRKLIRNNKTKQKNTSQRNVCEGLFHTEQLQHAHLFQKRLQLRTRGKQERSTEYTEEVKWLYGSCIVFRCIEFNQSDFDKTITFMWLTIAHILLCLPGWKYYSVSLFYTR